jgi:glutamate N-acetyltransferase/amino-acid N-acetyltransferase
VLVWLGQKIQALSWQIELMAVGLDSPDRIDSVAGVELAAGSGGVKSQGHDDLLLMTLAPGSVVSGVFTKNAYCAAPVTIAREHLAGGHIRALLINSGNANAGTGENGLQDARTLCRTVATAVGIDAAQVLPFSTGVIGERLPVDRMAAGVGRLAQELSAGNWVAAARAIMTTDTVPKAISRKVVIDSHTVTIAGISKGSGMIHPNMATMLAFVATDALVDQAALDRLTVSTTDTTFNCVTVDGDTSTNDAFITLATGCASNRVLDEQHPQWSEFVGALHEVCLFLAHAIVRDGEGATKFVEIEVSGGESQADCREVGLSVAHSPLVKTAFFAGDPNLGRILMAIGKSRVDNLDIGRVSLQLNDLSVVENGEPSAQYDESHASRIMAEAEFSIAIDLGRGSEKLSVWTSDLSYDYVKINAEYRS